MRVLCSAVSVALPSVAASGEKGPLSFHIGSCDRCRGEAASYAEMYRSLDALNDATVPAPGGLPQRVMSSLGPVAVPAPAGQRDHLVPVAAAAAIATAACGGAVLLRIYRQRAA
ncbi:MAG: hypothetical protein BMS9Abin17_0281 [Acidimicrobiia bacterium]|nr:MAG: hypothetical protein BMS9Abin17_0281 [Acidimicrobiia bacterium]